MNKKTNRTKKMSALLLALLLAGSMTACGGSGGSSAGTAEHSSASGVSDNESHAAEESGAADSSESGEDSAESGSSKSSSSSAESKSDESSVSDESSSGGASESSAAEGNAGNSGNTGNTGNASSGGNSSSGNASSGSTKTEESKSESGSGSQGSSSGNSGSTGSENSYVDEDSDLDTQDEEKPTKYIYLNGSSGKYDGEGISISGSKITISKGGHYEISGTLDNGQIYIMTDKKKVKLMLNNCSITNKAGAAIYCMQAKKVTLESLPGTVNTISDGGTHDEDNGAVFSEDTVVLKGEGVININGVYAHGIQSDDDIKVNGGTVNITAAKSCLHSNDGIEINAGTLYCYGGTNGIKTDGYITVTGGTSTFIGGVREDKGSIYCDGSFSITGGTFYAIGNTVTAPDAATTTANIIGLTFANAQPANTAVNVTSGGNQIFTLSSPNSFKTVMYAGGNLLKNASYNVTYGATVTGAVNYVGGTVSGGTDGGSFTAGNTVTIHNIT